MKSGWQYVETEGAREKMAPYTLTENVFAAEDGQPLLAQLRDLFYPVGSIKITTLPNNPGLSLGGVWCAWGAGRVAVGVDTSNSLFNEVEKRGGVQQTLHHHTVQSHVHSTSNCTLTLQQIPSHTHTISNVVHEGVGASGNYGNYPVRLRGDLAKNWGAQAVDAAGGNQPHNHGNTGASSPNTNDAATDTIQPYITCYMWKRTE